MGHRQITLYFIRRSPVEQHKRQVYLAHQPGRRGFMFPQKSKKERHFLRDIEQCHKLWSRPKWSLWCLWYNSPMSSVSASCESRSGTPSIWKYYLYYIFTVFPSIYWNGLFLSSYAILPAILIVTVSRVFVQWVLETCMHTVGFDTSWN